ncbi:uncharacterized protein LOC117317404 [Pecten maximus]|uniref:uncharacterized protein LOC117317404 n=1 Tax=Pecten maximus TaxID=6579 RepID=UPI0014588C97|nr:uncharacterized protein LOC117317404 [Pecten maximus]
MSKTEAAIRAVECFSSTPRLIKIAFVLINLAYLLFIVGFSTNGWVYTSRTGQSSIGRQGLFNHCAGSGIFTCCQSLNSYLSDHKVDGVPAWIDFTRAILSFGIISSSVAIVTIYICSMVDTNTVSRIKLLYLQRTCYIASYISGVFLLLGATVYGSMFGKDDWHSGASLHGSYGITTMAGIIFVIAGTATSATNQRNRSTVDNRPDEQDNCGPSETTIPTAPPVEQCCICLDNHVNAAFIPCGHESCCLDCANTLLNRPCPMCRVDIRNVLRTYRT